MPHHSGLCPLTCRFRYGALDQTKRSKKCSQKTAMSWSESEDLTQQKMTNQKHLPSKRKQVFGKKENQFCVNQIFGGSQPFSYSLVQSALPFSEF